MRILLVNKFLYPNGGSETYIFKLGDYLKEKGHEVEYFGMEHEGRCVGNRVNAYTSDMDFHGGSKLSKLTYPLKTIYSLESRRKIRLVLDDFKPDVVHLNNFNYQLTPSIILEVVKWRKQNKCKCTIVFTAHDGQLVCPNHLMQNYFTKQPCTECLNGSVKGCVKNKCIHGSTVKSVIGAMEKVFWDRIKVYKLIDLVISPSAFLAKKLNINKEISGRIIVLHNFVDNCVINKGHKEEYILYYGRYSEEKGIKTLLQVCKALPEQKFIFAGSGPMEQEVNGVDNVVNVGFKSGKELQSIIANACFTIVPSECFENCPFTVMESQMYGTPVIGADIGGIPELIEVGKTGDLFESGSAKDLKEKVEKLWNDKNRLNTYTDNCADIKFDNIDKYYKKLMKIYQGE